MKSRGFTLIELLVVIAIIGLLSSVILASLNSARAKANDAKTRADLNQLSLALQLYYDNHNAYPANPQPCCGVPITSVLQPLVSEGLISSLPVSPNPAFPYYYYDYGGTIGGLLVSVFTGSPPSVTGYPGSCRPWASGVNWCDQSSNTYYCVCNPY
jgi:prepilin-type N-terminal cleavage/methylation domain-containing protein